MSELLLPEDGELLKKAVEADTFQPLELITVLHNLKDSVRNVYLRLEPVSYTHLDVYKRQRHSWYCWQLW